MSFPDRNLNQTAVYWGTPVDDGDGGLTFADPVEIDCRWVDISEVITAASGEQIVSRAKVRVNQDLDERGMLYLGTLADLDSTQEGDPLSVDGAHEIRRFDKIPTIKANAYSRKAWL